MSRQRSEEFLNRLSWVVPGGASANARCGSPIAIACGEGAELIDLDGNRYVDYILGFGPILLGHGHPEVAEAVAKAMRRGTTFAFSHELEYAVAERIVRMCPSVEMVRLCNSGTDAATTCYRIAAARTSSNGVIKVQGDYHGGFDPVLHDVPGVEPGPPDCRPQPCGTGIIPAATDLVTTVPFNSVAAMEAALDLGSVAAVFMEPIMGNTAALMPEPGYLQAVRDLCSARRVVLVFDEVKTGFRVARGGAQEYLGVRSDLTMFGKALGNGLPIAAVGGRRDLMGLVCPNGVHHCGTYYGNLPCTAAAEAVLSILQAADYAALHRRGARLAEGIRGLLAAAGIAAHWHGVGAMFGITIGPERPRDYRSWWQQTDRRFWIAVANQLRDLGVLTDGFIGLFFLSFAHTDEQVDRTLAACAEAIRRCAGAG